MFGRWNDRFNLDGDEGCTSALGFPLPDYICRGAGRGNGDGGTGDEDLDCSTEALESIPGRFVECFGPVDTGSWDPEGDIDYTPPALAGVPVWLGWALILALLWWLLRGG